MHMWRMISTDSHVHMLTILKSHLVAKLTMQDACRADFWESVPMADEMRREPTHSPILKSHVVTSWWPSHLVTALSRSLGVMSLYNAYVAWLAVTRVTLSMVHDSYRDISPITRHALFWKHNSQKSSRYYIAYGTWLIQRHRSYLYETCLIQKTQFSKVVSLLNTLCFMTLTETSLINETRLILKNTIPENRLTRNCLIGQHWILSHESCMSRCPPPESSLMYDNPYVRLDSYMSQETWLILT